MAKTKISKIIIALLLALNLQSVFLMPAAPALAATTNISAVWANDGEDKVTQDELRASNHQNVLNSVWDGTTIKLFGAKNETVNFNLILEAAQTTTGNITYSFDRLDGPGGSVIQSRHVTGDEVFNWVGRPIENFYVRYQQIKGLSVKHLNGSYPIANEKNIPEKMRRPTNADGTVVAGTGWTDRPNHDKFYPEIAIPLELVPNFTIAAGNNQAVWSDIYIPKSAAAGLYRGNVTISENGQTVRSVPVELTVNNFQLPDNLNANSMLYISPNDIASRFFGNYYLPSSDPNFVKVTQATDRYHFLARRHGFTAVTDPFATSGSNNCTSADMPCNDMLHRLQANFFTSANGYDGPGAGVPLDLYVVGTYGSWNTEIMGVASTSPWYITTWSSTNEQTMWQHADAWVNWMEANAPNTEYFIYLIDEWPDAAQMEQWAKWIAEDPGPGHRLTSMATFVFWYWAADGTTPITATVPDLTMYAVGAYNSPKDLAQSAADSVKAAGKKLYVYNGARPYSGSIVVEDEGTALRTHGWIQYKKNIDRWFYFYGNLYDNGQTWPGGKPPELFNDPIGAISGSTPIPDPILGYVLKAPTKPDYSDVSPVANGLTLLMYPGTDSLYPQDNYGVNGPLASLRLKLWRRGIEDAAYLKMASQINSGATQQIINNMVPTVLWEGDVLNPASATTSPGVSWPTNPDVWEAARQQLTGIIATAYPMPPTISSFNASPSTIGIGQSSTLSWSVSGATSLTLDQGIGSVTNLNSKIVNPTATKTYTLTAANSGGSATAQTTVTVNPNADVTPPSVPANLSAAAASSTQVNLSWNPSTDISSSSTPASGVASYRIYRNGSLLVNTASTSTTFSDKTVLPATTYSYTVAAVDMAGNQSAPSPAVSALTPAGTLPPPPPPVSGQKLINDRGTYYLIDNGVRRGITNPGILASWGFSFNQAKAATSADLSLPQGGLLLPAGGSLIKSSADPTVYLVSGGQRYGFISADVFRSLGFKFSSVLTVTNPELQALPLALNLADPAAGHLTGLDININGTVYWIDSNYQLQGYPSLEVYNSWHIANDFSKVVPANSADLLLPKGEVAQARVMQ